MRTPTSGPLIISLVTVLAGAAMFATTTVTVVDGDTLTALAARHGVSTAQLVEWNDLDDPDRIYVGDVLLLSAPAGTPDGETAVQHVVSAGDTLSLIAARYGASVAAIAAANGLDDVDYIRVGQQLAIGGPVEDPEPDPIAGEGTGDAASAATDASTTTHTVEPGETLFSIALRYGRTVADLATANDIDDADRIRAGDVLIISPNDDSAGERGAPPEPTPAAETTTAEPVADATDAAGTEDQAGDGGDDAPVEPEPEPESAVDPTPNRAAPDPNASPAELDEAFDLWSLSYGVDQLLLESIAWYATDWEPATIGPDNRIGITQMTEGQVDLVETRLLGRDLDPLDGPDGIRLAARYLRYVQDRTDTELDALRAFRQGLDSLRTDGPTADAEAFALAVLNIRDQRL